jgi:hypothetical protein
MFASPLPPEAQAPTAVRWSAAQRVAFRFGFAYLLAYLLPTVAGLLPFPILIDRGFGYLLDHAVPHFGRHVLRLSGPVQQRQTGSGDTLFDWVTIALFAVVAALAAAIWSLASRRHELRRLHELLRIYVRYGLAATMFSYGFIKIFPAQFPAPDPARLMEPYGQFSPMGVLWAFMGVSTPYQIITGAGEVAGGVLLLFRRTASVGALLLLGVIGNVVLLNFCYDVPVKQYSLHLWLMALFLAAPDLRLLFETLVRRRAVQPRPVDWEPARRRWRLALRISKAALVAWMLFIGAFRGWKGYQQWGPGRAALPFEGIWTVEDRGEGSPPWLRVGLGSWRASVTTPDQPYTAYGLRYDDKSGRLTLMERNAGERSFKVRVEGKSLHLEGDFRLRLQRVEPAEIPLRTRRFHWVQEFPFNR